MFIVTTIRGCHSSPVAAVSKGDRRFSPRRLPWQRVHTPRSLIFQSYTLIGTSHLPCQELCSSVRQCAAVQYQVHPLLCFAFGSISIFRSVVYIGIDVGYYVQRNRGSSSPVEHGRSLSNTAVKHRFILVIYSFEIMHHRAISNTSVKATSRFQWISSGFTSIPF